MIEKIHLSILREISRSGSVTAAAAKLHLTQSAISHSIKKLEQHASVNLWLKDGQSLVIVPTG